MRVPYGRKRCRPCDHLAPSSPGTFHLARNKGSVYAQWKQPYLYPSPEFPPALDSPLPYPARTLLASCTRLTVLWWVARSRLCESSPPWSLLRGSASSNRQWRVFWRPAFVPMIRQHAMHDMVTALVYPVQFSHPLRRARFSSRFFDASPSPSVSDNTQSK